MQSRSRRVCAILFVPLPGRRIDGLSKYLGSVHPPVGMNIFVIKSVIDDVKISTIFSGVLPFIVTDILRLALLIVFPIIALWLPSRM